MWKTTNTYILRQKKYAVKQAEDTHKPASFRDHRERLSRRIDYYVHWHCVLLPADDSSGVAAAHFPLLLKDWNWTSTIKTSKPHRLEHCTRFILPLFYHSHGRITCLRLWLVSINFSTYKSKNKISYLFCQILGTYNLGTYKSQASAPLFKMK